MVTPASRTVVEHSRVNPVFVLGHPRSGTSLTCRLLLDHLGINFGTESQFIVRLYQRLDRYGDLHDDRRLRHLFEDISKERFFERTRHNFGFCLDIHRAMRAMEERTYAGALRAIFGQFAASQGLVRWGDKTPEYSRHLPLFRRLFPDAQYVHVVRDGRRVAVSMLKTGFGAKTALEAAKEWTHCVERIQRFGQEMPPDQFLEIRYEDLIAEPVHTMARVAEFLGVVGHETAVASLRERLRAQVRQDGAHGQSGFWTRRELECFEAIAGEQLAALGYQLDFPARPRRIGTVETALWRARGAYRRLRNPQYWADNWYKLRLRARYASRPLRLLARS
jgi:hypothetical protein